MPMCEAETVVDQSSAIPLPAIAGKHSGVDLFHQNLSLCRRIKNASCFQKSSICFFCALAFYKIFAFY